MVSLIAFNSCSYVADLIGGCTLFGLVIGGWGFCVIVFVIVSIIGVVLVVMPRSTRIVLLPKMVRLIVGIL